MQYKRKKATDSKSDYFVYKPQHSKNNKKKIKKFNDKSPFNKLSELRFR